MRAITTANGRREGWTVEMYRRAAATALGLNAEDERYSDGYRTFNAARYASTFGFCTDRERLAVKRVCEEAWAWGMSLPRDDFRTQNLANIRAARRAIWMPTNE